MARAPISTTLRRLALACTAALPLAAHALCTSDDVPQPAVVLERFTSADCGDCWQDPATPAPAANALALDWVLPGLQGEDAPLSAVALDEAQERILFLGEEAPQRALAVSGIRQGQVAVRLAQGGAFNDYIAASIELQNGGRGPWQAWLLLVESLPAGTEGSPVARNLVRNVFRPDWARPVSRRPGRLAETRAIQIHAGASPERLRLVAIVQDARGSIKAITQTECR